jgi:hypothetical protein
LLPEGVKPESSSSQDNNPVKHLCFIVSGFYRPGNILFPATPYLSLFGAEEFVAAGGPLEVDRVGDCDQHRVCAAEVEGVEGEPAEEVAQYYSWLSAPIAVKSLRQLMEVSL